MIRHAFLAVVATIAVTIVMIPCASVAAGKHGLKDRLEPLGNRGNLALGPRIDYPRDPDRLSSSSDRYYTGGQVNSIPFRSPAEALEIVPGLAVGR